MSEPHDTVVVTGGGGSSVGGILIGLIVLVLMGPGATRSDHPTDVNVQVQLPTAVP
jgi:hypothetical protein